MPPKKRCRHDAETFSKAFRIGDVEAHEAEIDRRVAEERAKLLERLRDIKEAWDWWQVDTYDRCASVVDEAIIGALAQFEKENSHEQG